MNSSNHSLDLRARRTNKFMWEALMALMAEQDFESITVTAICERAMVHRTTFYKHYQDKYGLLSHGIQDELHSLFEAFDAAMRAPVAMEAVPDPMAHVGTVFAHVRKHERFYRLMLTGDGISIFSTRVRKSLAERLEQRLRREGKQTAMPLALHAELHAAAMVSMLAWWLEHDCQYTPVEMAEYPWHAFFS